MDMTMELDERRADVAEDDPQAVARLSPQCASRAFDALRTMANASFRSQAELRVALHRAGLRLTASCETDLISALSEAQLIENVIELTDGGIFVTVIGSGSASRDGGVDRNAFSTVYAPRLRETVG